MRAPERAADHVELRRDLQVEIFFGIVATVLALGLGTLQASQITGLLWFGAAAFMGTATAGIWFAREWARWTFGFLAALFAIGAAANVIMNFTATVPVHKVVDWIIQTSFWGCVAVCMFQASTRQSFRNARKAIMKARAPSARGEGPSRRPTLG